MQLLNASPEDEIKIT